MICLLPLLLLAQNVAPSTPRVEAPRVAVRTTEPVVVRRHAAKAVTGHQHVADLMKTLGTVPMGQGPGAGLEALDDLMSALKQANSRATTLVDVIRERMQPPLLEGEHRAEHLGRGELILIGTAAQQAWMEAFLVGAVAEDQMIEVEIQIIELAASELSGLEFHQGGRVLPSSRVSSLLTGWRSHPQVDILSAPKVVMFPFGKANLSVLEETAYIKDYEVVSIPALESSIADPVIDVLTSGIVIDVRAVPLPDDGVSLDLDLTYSVHSDPIPTLKTTVEGESGPIQVTIQLPEITKTRLDGVFALKPDQTLVMVAKSPDGAGEVLFLVNARRVDAEAGDGDSR